MMAMLTMEHSASPTNKVLLVTTLSLQEERLNEATSSTVLLSMAKVLGEETESY